MIYIDELNGKLLKNFGAFVLTGTADLLSFPERKEVYENDWAEQNGSECSLDEPRFKDKDITLKIGILAKNDAEFWDNYNRLFAELSKPNFQRLYIADHSQHYAVFYKKSGEFKKVLKRLRGVEKVFVKFDLVFRVAYDTAVFDAEYQTGGMLKIHSTFDKSLRGTEIRKIAKIISQNEPVILHDSIDIMLKQGIYQPSIDGYISGRRSKFVLLKNIDSKDIRRHLSKCQKKKAETIVFITKLGNQSIWKTEIKKALNYVSKWFNPEFRILFTNGNSVLEYT